MSLNKGTIIYGDTTILPGLDTAGSGFGNFNVAGTALLAGASTSVTGVLNVTGAANLSSTLTLGGAAIFNSTVTFNNPSSFVGDMIISSTTNSTSTNTGALQVKGGVGILLNTNMGGTLTVSGASTFSSTLAVTGTSTLTGAVTVQDTTQSTHYSNGSLVVAGGLGVAGNIRSGIGSLFLSGNLVLRCDSTTGIAYLNSPSNDLYINQNGIYDVYLNNNSSKNFNVANALTVNTAGVQVLTNTDSSSTTTGALVVTGGAGIAMSVNIGGNITAPINKTLTIGSGLITNTAQSTSTTTGSLQTTGGFGVAKNVFVGGFIDVASTAATYSSIGNVRILSSASSANWIQSGDLGRTANNWTTLKYAPLGSTTSIFSINATNVTVDTGTAASSSTTGALVVTGGTGISGDLYVGGNTTFTGYTSRLADTWMNNNNIYLRAYNGQSDGLVYSATASTGGPFLFGLNGGALGTTTGATAVALTWDSTLSIQIKGTTDSSSGITGALTVAGGIGAVKSIYSGGSYLLQTTSITSTGADINVNANASSVRIRNTAGSTSGEFSSNTLFFNFKTIDITTPSPIASYTTFIIDKTTGYTLVKNTDDSTAIDTGSFQVSGGASVSKSLFVGGNASITGNLSVSGSFSMNSSNPVIFSGTTNSTSITTGAVVITGGLGIGQDVYIGGIERIVNTTDSTSATTGALAVAGGVGISGALFVGSNVSLGSGLTVSGNITSSTGVLTIPNTTSSNSVSSGAVIISGGIGVGENLNVGGISKVTNTTVSTAVTNGAFVVAGGVGISGAINTGGILSVTNTTASTSSTTGSFIAAGGVGIAQNLNVGGNANVSGALTVTGNISSTGGTVRFTNTLDSTSPVSGSVIIDGGIGIAKSVFVGSTTDSTSGASGSLVLSGGLGVAKNFFLSGNQTLAGTNPLLTFGSSGLGAPTFTSRSAGTKLLLNSAITTALVDYAFGVETNATWFSVPGNTSTYTFKWYGGTTQAMSLDGLGTMIMAGTIDSTSSISGALQLAGGAGIAKSLYVGGALNVTSTAFFTGSVTAQTNVTAGGIFSVTNSTQSTTSGTGAIITNGGLGVALNANIGQNLGVTGNSSITGNLTLTGTAAFNNVTDSTTIANGAAVFAGGVGIAKSLNVGGALIVAGSTTISGNLYVTGTRTEVNTGIITTKDNVILINSAPSGSATTGVATKRYQFANDAGTGDVVTNDTPEHTGTCQTGSSATTVVLSTSASSVDGWYNGGWVYLNSGTGSGQVRRINTYIGATRTATIYSSADQASLTPIPVEGLDWTTVPDATSAYAVYTSQYILSVYDEVNKEFAFGSSAVNPVNDAYVPIRNRVKLHAGALSLDGTLKVDTISNFTTNAGTTVEGVLIKNGALSGVNTINGTSVNVTSTVQLIDNDSNATVSIPGTTTYGAYLILVMDTVNTGSSAAFMITGSASRGGSVFRATSTVGANNEHLTITWAIGEVPHLKWMNLPSNGTGANYSFLVRAMPV